MGTAIFSQTAALIWVDALPPGVTTANAIGVQPWTMMDKLQDHRAVFEGFARCVLNGQAQHLVVEVKGNKLDFRFEKLPEPGFIVGQCRLLPIVELTNRERDILQFLCDDVGPTEAARRLGVTVSTIETHRSHLLRKLNVHGTAGAVRWAIRHGIIEP